MEKQMVKSFYLDFFSKCNSDKYTSSKNVGDT